MDRQRNGQKKKEQKERQHMAKRKRDKRKDNTWPKEKGTKRPTMIYKTLHRKLKTEQHERQ